MSDCQFFPGAHFVGGTFVELTALDKIIYQVATNHLNLESVCDDRKFVHINNFFAIADRALY